MAWLCIDAGTSVIKSVVYTEEGRELSLARASVTVLHPQPGFAEQDMDEVWSAVVSTARAAVAEAAVAIHAIAMTAQGDGAWLVDRHGAPVQNAILWNDGRATAIVDEWKAAGVLDRGAKISGSMSYPGLPNSIWRWLAAHQPGILERSHASLTCNGWLYLKLTGAVAAHLSDASNPFCDVRSRQYSTELLSLYGVEEWRHLLPDILSGTQQPLGVLASTAEAMDVPAGIPVVMAPYDIVATAWGGGTIEAAQACVILGTTVCAEVITHDFDTQSSGTTIALEDDGAFLRAMPTLTGCEALAWVADRLKVDSLDALASLAETSPVGAGGVVFLPYLSPAGERSPFLAPHARGSWSCVSLAHGDRHLARSVYEGLSYVIRECLAAASPGALSEICVCGGGTRSDFWCQMIADVTACDVIRSEDQEPGAKGALLYGKWKLGESATLQEALRETASSEERFRPNVDDRRAYEAGYQRFLKLRTHASELWTSLCEGVAND